MAKTDTGRSVRVFVPPMIQRGAILGLALALSEWFLVSFDVATLGVGFTVFGIVLALYGDRSWVDVGRVLAAVGLTSILATESLIALFG